MSTEAISAATGTMASMVPLAATAGIASRVGRRAKVSPPKRKRKRAVVKRKARVLKRKATPKRRVKQAVRRRGVRRG